MGFHKNTGSGLESYDKMILNDILDATEYLTTGNIFDRDGVRLSEDKCGFILINKENQLLSKLVRWNIELINELQSKIGIEALGEMKVETMGVSLEMVYGMTLNPLYISYYVDNIKNK